MQTKNKEQLKQQLKTQLSALVIYLSLVAIGIAFFGACLVVVGWILK